MAETGFRWVTSPSVIVAGLSRYEQMVLDAAKRLLEYYSPQVESAAKAGAPWTDRTGNARQGLFSIVEAEKDRVVLYLSHGVEYGVFLELRWQGRYAIIVRTLQSYHGPIGSALKGMLTG